MNNPSLPVAELDSVEGIKGGSVLLTIHFVLPKLQLAFLREANDSKSVTDIFDHLYELLGFDNFTKLFPYVWPTTEPSFLILSVLKLTQMV